MHFPFLCLYSWNCTLDYFFFYDVAIKHYSTTKDYSISSLNIQFNCFPKRIKKQQLQTFLEELKNKAFFHLGILENFLSLLFFNTKKKKKFVCIIVFFYCFCAFWWIVLEHFVYLLVFVLLYGFVVWWLAVKLKWTSTRHVNLYVQCTYRRISHTCGY